MTGWLASRLERIWYPGAGSGEAPPAVLRAAAALHALASRARAGAYDRRLLAVRRLPVPCVSVGNLSVGGTGKTPLVAWLVEQFLAAGARPAVVSRGYGGSERGPARGPPAGGDAAASRFGDEPALLAAGFPQVPVVVGRDRHAGIVSGEQSRLVAEPSGRGAVTIGQDALRAACAPAVPAGDDCGASADPGQTLDQPGDQGGLAGAADAEIADADAGHGEAVRGEKPAIVGT